MKAETSHLQFLQTVMGIFDVQSRLSSIIEQNDLTHDVDFVFVFVLFLHMLIHRNMHADTVYLGGGRNPVTQLTFLLLYS